MTFKRFGDESSEQYKKLQEVGKCLFCLPFSDGDSLQMCLVKLFNEHVKLLKRVNAHDAIARSECHCNTCFEENAHYDVCDWENEGRCNGDGCYKVYLDKEEIDGAYFRKCIDIAESK